MVENYQVGEVGDQVDDPRMSVAAVPVCLHNTWPQSIISEFRPTLLRGPPTYQAR